MANSGSGGVWNVADAYSAAGYCFGDCGYVGSFSMLAPLLGAVARERLDISGGTCFPMTVDGWVVPGVSCIRLVCCRGTVVSVVTVLMSSSVSFVVSTLNLTPGRVTFLERRLRFAVTAIGVSVGSSSVMHAGCFE